MKTLQEQGRFFLKVARNGLILAGLYFVSVWAGAELTWETTKPLIIFFATYVLTELARYYKLKGAAEPMSKKANLNISPLIY